MKALVDTRFSTKRVMTMCGIFGYTGNGNAVPMTVEGLKSLEYRGYDSMGIAIDSTSEGLVVRKDVGKVSDVSQKLMLDKLNAKIAIGQTRWATHGKVTKENAHPHTDCSGSIAVVDNGIIENYLVLRENLISKGHSFKSETDTEVIPHMIEENIKKGMDFYKACTETFKALEGSFAVLVLANGEDQIIAVKKGPSPLAIGSSKNGIFVASDVAAFLKYTNKVTYLTDNEVVVIGKNVELYNMSEQVKKRIIRAPTTVKWKYFSPSKSGFNHYAMKEISEQAITVQRAIMQDSALFSKAVKIISESKSVWFVASGSSYHACVAAKYLFSKIANIHVEAVLASEFKHYAHLIPEKTAVIAVSQSGESYDVLEAVKFAKGNGCKVIALVNVPGSTLYNESDVHLEMNAGREISVAATKTQTSQLALLDYLAYSLAGRQPEGKMRIKRLVDTVGILTSEASINALKELALKLKNNTSLVCIGRGLQYATALEAALKIKEISYIHAEAFAGGELKHGSIALIEKDTPCIVFVSGDNETEILSNAAEVKSRGGYIIGVSPKNNKLFDFWIEVPELESENPIVQIIPIQILAYYLSVSKGLYPDMPRNLAKSVTVK